MDFAAKGNPQEGTVSDLRVEQGTMPARAKRTDERPPEDIGPAPPADHDLEGPLTASTKRE